MGAPPCEGVGTKVVLACIEQPSVRQALDAATLQWTGAELAWEALTWVICRDPEAGQPITESGRVRTYEIQGARSRDMPSVAVIYEETVFGIIIHDATFSQAKAFVAGTA